MISTHFRLFLGVVLMVIAILLLLSKRDHGSSGPNEIRPSEPPPRLINRDRAEPNQISLPVSQASNGITVEVYGTIRSRELAFRFPTQDSYHAFIASLESSPVQLIHQLDRLHATRVSYDDWQDVLDLLAEHNIIDVKNHIHLPDFGFPGGGIQNNPISIDRTLLTWLGISDASVGYGAGVRIAVIDTGVVPHNALPELAGNFAIEPYPKELSETNPHGTAVASLIAGEMGIARESEIISIRVCNESGKTDSYNLAAAILLAVDANVHLINLSMGGLTSTSLDAEAIRIAQEEGIIVVAGAGNEGRNHLSYPAAYPGVVSVGALDAGGERMAFSNMGDLLTIAAPGFGILAAAPGNRYIKFSGTSASAPIMTGAIAAVMSDGSGHFLTPEEAVGIIKAYSDDIGPPGQDSEYGAGIINLFRVFNRNTHGIIDAAITDQRLVTNKSPNVPNTLKVTLQNRGTVSLMNTQLSVMFSNYVETRNVTLMQPGEIKSITIPWPFNVEESGKFVTIQSRIELTQTSSYTNHQNLTREDQILAP